MRSLFDPSECMQMVDRINKLSPQSQAEWGTMNVAQMLAHCQVPLRLATGEQSFQRVLAGIIFGGFAKKQLVKPEPFKRGLPTAKEFIIRDERDFETEKKLLINLLEKFCSNGPEGLSEDPHPFFGRMTESEWDILQWKHLDHHLRQFGA